MRLKTVGLPCLCTFWLPFIVPVIVCLHIRCRCLGGVVPCIFHPFIWSLRVCAAILVRKGTLTGECVVHPQRKETSMQGYPARVALSNAMETPFECGTEKAWCNHCV